MGYYFSFFDFNDFKFMKHHFCVWFLRISVCFFVFVSVVSSFPDLSRAALLTPIVRNPSSGLAGSQSYPLYEVTPGVFHINMSGNNTSNPHQSVPVKTCLWGLVDDYSGTNGAYNTYYSSPQYYDSAQYQNFTYITSCEFWVYKFQVPGSVDAFGDNTCSYLNKVNNDFLSKFLFFLPDVPQHFRIPYILSQFAGGNNSLLGFLLSEIWLQISPLLILYIGVKAYKLLPFV